MTVDQLPRGWFLAELAELGNVVTGKTPSTKNVANFGGGIPFIKPGDLNGGGFISRTADTLSQQGAGLVPNLPKNSITVTCIGNLGKIGITTKLSATNQQINSVVPDDHIDYKYLYYQLLTLRPWLESEASATTVAIINKSKFAKAPIVLPPLAEQKAIAQKLDTLLAQVETTKARLDRIPDILKGFRQSVLAAAVSGKLTEEWREHGNYLPINTTEIRSNFELPEDFLGYEIPSSWIKIPIGNICTFQQGMQIAKSERFQAPSPDRLPILRIGNYATNFEMDVDYVELDNNSLIAEAEDLILTRTGETRGRVLTGFRGVFHNNTFRINFNKNIISRDYLYYAVNELGAQKYILFVSGRSAQPDLTHKKFGPCPISIPSLHEQTQIVKQVETLFAHADAIEKQVQAAQTRVNSLTQSILAKAFRGELTAEWRAANPELISGENSSDALLAKIKAERDAAKPKKKARARK